MSRIGAGILQRGLGRDRLIGIRPTRRIEFSPEPRSGSAVGVSDALKKTDPADRQRPSVRLMFEAALDVLLARAKGAQDNRLSHGRAAKRLKRKNLGGRAQRGRPVHQRWSGPGSEISGAPPTEIGPSGFEGWTVLFIGLKT